MTPNASQVTRADSQVTPFGGFEFGLDLILDGLGTTTYARGVPRCALRHIRRYFA